MKTLRPYQVRGKADIYREWEISDILFYLLATGGGKTFQFVDLAKDFLSQGLRVTVVAHTEELIQNTWDTLHAERIFAGIIQGSTKTNYALPCQVCSIQTIVRREHLPHTDIFILDEGHHATKKNSYGKILARFPNAKVLLVSATCYRLSGEGFLDLVEGKTTRLIVNCTLKTLIGDGWLVPLDYFASFNPDMSNAGTGADGDYLAADAEKAMQYAPVVENYLEHCKGLQGIVFAQTVTHSKTLCVKFIKAGIMAQHLDSNTPDSDYYENGILCRGRKSIIRDYIAKIITVVINVGILVEGVDFPLCEFVGLAKRTKSLSAFFQMVGRVTRPIRGVVDNPLLLTAGQRKQAIANSAKPVGIVLDCSGMVYEHGGTPDTMDVDWEKYFRGWKDEKKKAKEVTEEIEILLFEVEAEDGTRRKTSNIRETYGLKIVRITKETIRKAINIKSIREFDRLYAQFKRTTRVKTPGSLAVNKFIEYCNKERILMVPEIWDYLHKKTVEEIEARIKEQKRIFDQYKGQYPDTVIESTLANIQKEGVSGKWLLYKRKDYFIVNEEQIISYIQDKV